MSMYNFIEYSDSCSDISVSLWQFQKDERDMNNENPAIVTTADSTSFKFKSCILENPNNVEYQKTGKQLLQ